MFKKALLFSLLIFVKLSSVVIIVHGTFAQKSNWHSSDGDFFQELETQATLIGEKVITFGWSGGILQSDILQSAKNLTKLILSFSGQNIVCIGHSRGGQIICMASQILKATGHNKIINKAYALGMPVDSTNLPNMDIIGEFYNLYSKSDPIQAIFGILKRKIRGYERVTNLRLKMFKKNHKKKLGHRDLHSKIIAKWILSIPETLKLTKIGNFENFKTGQDAYVEFIDGIPVYRV